MNKIKYGIAAALGGVGAFVAALAGATTSTVDTLPTTFGGILDGVVQAVINTAVTFFTSNLPLIVVVGVSIGLVWFLIYKVKGALHGR